MKDYPHISDTKYPDLDTVDVYKIENKFDYSRWGVGTQVKLCNVLFNADYADVVKFDDDVARDAYFDALDGRIVTLQTAFQQVPRDAIKIPIPYDSAIRYNYLYIDIPTPTSDAQPIDYVSSDRVKRYFFFISDIEQLAPNTSKVSIVLDEWTTYINDVSIPYMMLERGHAPVAAVNTDDYLTNPRAKCEYLLAPDVIYGDIDSVSSSKWVPIGAGEKYVCFATTYSITQLQGIAVGEDANPTTGASYSDAAGRAGYRMVVSDYNYGMGGVTFDDIETPVQAFNIGYRADVPSLFTYAVKAAAARSFFDYLSRRAPHVMQTIQACYVLGDDVAQFYDEFTFQDYTLYKVAPRKLDVYFELDKNMFGYDSRYERFAKLYTYPYAVMEVSDNNGSSFQIRIEDITSTSHLQANLAIAYPYLQYQVSAIDINGRGTNVYKWGTIDNRTENVTVPISDFAAYMIQWDVPVYALFERSYDQYRLTQYWQAQLARANAITAYEQAQRMANTTDANTHATNATNVSNTINSTNTALANVRTANAASVEAVNESNDTSAQQWSYSDSKTRDYYSADVTLMRNTLESNNDLLAVQNTTAQLSNGVNAAAGAVTSAISGNALGAIASVGSGIMNAVTTDMNYNATVQANNTVEAAQEANALSKFTSTIQTAYDQMTESNALSSRLNTISTDATLNQMNANKAMQDTNAQNTANTSNANADYTRNAQQENNAQNMSVAQRGQTYGYRTARVQGQIQIGSFAGDPTLDARQRRGVSMRVKTQRKSDIAQTAAQFARYGYNLNQVWDMRSGFNLMHHFTYWKAADAWVNDDKGTPNAVQLSIQAILLQGVTVWNDPDIIGRVSVYDN